MFPIFCVLYGDRRGAAHMGMRGVVSKHERLSDER
jgi:hypothetical protein